MKNSLNGRLQKWDILKCFLIFLVVLGHVADFYTKESQGMRNLYLLIYTFHMPLFIFVSGLFSKKTVNEKRKEKIFGYLSLYIVIKLIFALYNAIAYGKFEFSLFTEPHLPWFMLALFAFAVITIAVRDFSPKYVLFFSILLACLAGYDREINSFLSLSRIIVYYPFYYLGYLLDAAKIEEFCRKKGAKCAAAVILTAAITVAFVFGEKLYWLRPLVTGLNPFAALGGHWKFGFLLRLGFYAVSGLICFAVVVLTPDKTPLGVAAKIGKRTLPIYAFHYIILFILYYKVGINSLFEKILPETPELLGIPLAVLVMFISSAGIFDKIMNLAANPMAILKK